MSSGLLFKRLNNSSIYNFNNSIYHQFQSTIPFNTTTTTTTTNSIRLASSSSNLYPFPTKKNPTPFEIFHLNPSDSTTLTSKQIKSRYYELCLIHHPDTNTTTTTSSNKGKGKASSPSSTTTTSVSDEKFRQIVEAYEVLRNPNRRSIYLRTGYSGASGSSTSSAYSATNAGYDFSRGRPMRNGGSAAHRGPYPSAAWDWADSYNPHFRPPNNHSYTTGTQTSSGWNTQGQLSSNGTIVLVLIAATLLITPISVWTVVDPGAILFGEEGSVQYTGGRESRHANAARALETARREGKSGGLAKREAIRKRVREIEYERGTERAMDVIRTERGSITTGHPSLQLALPPPSDSTSSSSPTV